MVNDIPNNTNQCIQAYQQQNTNRMRPHPKKQYALNFLQSLIVQPQFKMFLDFDQLSCGFFDFEFITRHPARSLYKIREDLKNKKNYSFQMFLSQIKKMFKQISDYILLNDPLQQVCEYGLDLVSNFQKQYANQFKKKKNKNEASSQEQINTPNMQKQLQMIFYLRNYDHDEQTLRKIGEVCQVMSQTEQQYIFDLSASNLWEPIIYRPNE